MPEIETKVRTIVPISARSMIGKDSGVIQLSWRISEDAIRMFCMGCSKLQDDNSCPLVGSNNQAIAARRGWCNWASVGRTLGWMTKDGYVGGRQHSIRR